MFKKLSSYQRCCRVALIGAVALLTACGDTAKHIDTSGRELSILCFGGMAYVHFDRSIAPYYKSQTDVYRCDELRLR